MMTAVMMKADTRPARRGSNVRESWTIVGSPPTLSWEGVLAWSLASAEGLVVWVMVVFRSDLLVVGGCSSDCDVVCCVARVGDSDLGGS